MPIIVPSHISLKDIDTPLKNVFMVAISDCKYYTVKTIFLVNEKYAG